MPQDFAAVPEHAFIVEGHAIAGRAKAEILRRVPSVAHVLIHFEPAEPGAPSDAEA